MTIAAAFYCWERSGRCEGGFKRRSFELLKEAYVKARYSKHYKITEEELTWLGERAETLATMVKTACEKRLKKLKAAAGK